MLGGEELEQLIRDEEIENRKRLVKKSLIVLDLFYKDHKDKYRGFFFYKDRSRKRKVIYARQSWQTKKVYIGEEPYLNYKEKIDKFLEKENANLGN